MSRPPQGDELIRKVLTLMRDREVRTTVDINTLIGASKKGIWKVLGRANRAGWLIIEKKDWYGNHYRITDGGREQLGRLERAMYFMHAKVKVRIPTLARQWFEV